MNLQLSGKHALVCVASPSWDPMTYAWVGR